MRLPLFSSNPYAKTQKYDVCFQVEVKNLSSSENIVRVIMPFPFESSYQKLLGKFRIIPSAGTLRKEGKFQNSYISWQQNLGPNELKNFKLFFKISVKPREGVLKTDNKVSAFLKSDRFVDVKRAKKLSNDLAHGITDDFEKVKVFNNYVVKNLKYGDPIKGLYSSNEALTRDRVDCGGFDSLLAALCIAQKIPSRVISGFFTGSNDNQMHAWVEIFLPNRGWLVADPSIEKLSSEGRSKKYARLGFVGSDRIALSVGHNFKIMLNGKLLNLDILQNPIIVSSKKVKYTSNFQAKRIK